MTISRSCIIVFSIFTSVFANASNSGANTQEALNKYHAAQAVIDLVRGQEENQALRQQAISLWEEALKLDPTLQELPKTIYRNLATVNFSLGHSVRAFNYYLRALKEEGEKFPLNSLKHLAMTCMEITMIHNKNNNLEQSEQYNLLAKEFFEIFIAKTTQPFSAALCLDIANVYLSADEYENSLIWHNRASNIAQETKTALPERFAASYSFLMKKLGKK